jgi:ATP-dependent DNA helicase RecG
MRPQLLNPLFAEATSLSGVGAGVAKLLARLGIERAVDALFHLPTMFIDRQRVLRADAADVGRTIVLAVRVTGYDQRGARSPFRVRVEDEGGERLSLVYFGGNGGWAKKLFPLGETRIISGRLDSYGGALQIVHPDHVVMPGEIDTVPAREPVYPLTEGMPNKKLGWIIGQALERAPALDEWIEPSVLDRRDWPGWREALTAAHGEAADAGSPARNRLAYDELFANQLALMLMRASSRRRRGYPLRGDGRLVDPLLGGLPYRPTGAQSRAIGEITGDMAQVQPMLRLLQGDVGSGKTLVALAALLTAIESGAQGALLAPTEILARQHFANISALVQDLPVRVAILTGRDKGKPREALLADLAAGRIDLLIGTHAIFQEAVTYKALGLAVVDEQHRFGVAQRMMLSAKAERPPHLLVMTATPIPRTLTLTSYGEMDVSRLDEMPPGREPIETRVLSLERIDEVMEALGRHIASGARAYWVCPMVSGEEDADVAAAEARAAILRARFGEAVGLIHGRMKGPEKDVVMAALQAGEHRIPVATTVIEVGVDVPEATLIVVEAAERFGLAQLHQLRGRVGRGGGRSICLLLRGNALSEAARARLTLMRETNDGFRIAEEDLRLRGAGEILGLRQSGEAQFRLASPEHVQALLQTATDDARLLVDRDGGLEGPRGTAARTALYLFERDAAVSLVRSG